MPDVRSLSFAVCTFNRAERLGPLLERMRAQACPVPYEVLVVDNNSTDRTAEVVARVAATPGVAVRYVLEREQGIPFARNRALAEAMDRDCLVFMDDDELPGDGLLDAAVRALSQQGARCAGGKVKVRFEAGHRPAWLGDEMLGFLAEVDYGDEAFWIRDASTPIWTANVAYDMSLFRDEPQLRFDARYNRRGYGVGGGSDAIMFKALLARGVSMRYVPEMVVDHHVEPWRLHRRYFLRLRFDSGRKWGQYETEEYSRTFVGVPPFMLVQAVRHWARAAMHYLRRRPDALRQAMNGAHATGAIWGRVRRHRELAPRRY